METTYFGANLRAIRKYFHLTQFQISGFLLIDRSLVSKYEHGHKQPTVDCLDRLVHLTGLDPKILLFKQVDVSRIPLDLLAEPVKKTDS
jgi:transcriptional regulator with XRE-family HTH domain